jgi:MFS family permease
MTARNEFARGWPLLLGGFLGIAAGLGSLYFYSLGLFLKPLAETFGWSRGQASLGPLVGTLCSALASMPSGRLMDRIGPARIAIIAMVLLAAGFAALGFATGGLASFLLITAVTSLVTLGSTPLAYTRLVVGAFDRHRGVALALVLTGTGIGAMLTPILLLPYIAAHGWRSGYFALAVVVLVATPVVAMLIARRGTAPARGAASSPIASVLGEPAFGLLGAIFLLAAIGVLGTVVHFVPMLTDAGLPPTRAGAIAGAIGMAVIGGRVLAGLLLDRLPAYGVTAGLFAIPAVGMALLAAGGATLALPGALAIGLGVGAEIDLIAFLVARHFPRADYGAAYGGIYSLFLVGGAIGPALVGTLFDLTGGYAMPMLLSAVSLTAAAGLALRLRSLPAAQNEI